MFAFMLFLAAPQAADQYLCGGSNDIVDCHTASGATYIERRLGDRVIRKGTDAKGRSWTEYIVPDGDGQRTLGEDDRGRTWASRCSSRYGTSGTDRDGKAIYKPPMPMPKPSTDLLGRPVPPPDPCL